MMNLTAYNAWLCDDCAASLPPHLLTPVTEADIRDVYGYESACCEECKTLLYDGLAATV